MNTNDIAAEAVRRRPGRPPKSAATTPAQPTAASSTPAPSTDTAPTPSRVRKPFGNRGQKLAYPSRAGFRRHWFNDKDYNIMEAKEAGYEHVIGPDGKPVARPVGVLEAGGVMMGFLMEIPQQYFDEDMAVQQAKIDEMDNAIRKGQVNESEGDRRYVPKNPDGSLRISIKQG